MPKTDEETIRKILSRGVEEVVEREHLERRLRAGEKLRIKLGIDPTAPALHLGHTVVLRKLRQFQDAGHQAVLIIGDFTAQIGDPSGRNKARPPLTERDVKTNMKKYLAEAGRVIDVKKAEIRHNGEWLGKMGFGDIQNLLAQFSLQQFTEREDFQSRIAAHQPLWMNELLYPALQAYDSVAVRADVELGGRDQRLNLLAGRALMEKRGMVPQDILTTPLIEGTDGSHKMSKSYGNYIGIAEEPREMFGKLMTVPDALLPKYFETLTDFDAPKDMHPRDAKLFLAETITSLYHGEEKARAAREAFTETFSGRKAPHDAPELEAPAAGTVLDLVTATGMSKNEARRLIAANAVEINDAVRSNPHEKMPLQDGDILKIGKHRFYKLRITRR